MKFSLTYQPSLLKHKRAPAATKVAPPAPPTVKPAASRAAKPRKARGWNGPPATLETINGADYIVLRLPMAKQPKLSKSAKSHIIGSTRGRRRVWHVDSRTGEKTPVTVNGIHICAIATAYAVLRESPEADTV